MEWNGQKGEFDAMRLSEIAQEKGLQLAKQLMCYVCRYDDSFDCAAVWNELAAHPHSHHSQMFSLKYLEEKKRSAGTRMLAIHQSNIFGVQKLYIFRYAY